MERLVQAPEHFVEDARQVAELVVGVVDGQPIAQPGSRDRSCPLGHALDGRQRAAGERVATQTRRRGADGEAKQKEERELTELQVERSLRSRDLNDDARSTDD